MISVKTSSTGLTSVVILGLSVLCVAAGTMLHGRATGRWASADLAERAAAVESLPASVGDWESEILKMDANSLEIADVVGSVCRQYTHRYTKEQIVVLVVSGRPGHIAAHPPEVCYSGAGYVVSHKQVRELGPESTAWQADFVRPTDTLRIVWGWGTGDRWTASNSPRLEFATAGNLFKIYVIRRATDKAKDDEVLSKFLTAYLPECHRRLSPRPAENSGR